MTKVFRVRAPAKINLALHVTGQRADGYHLLDTLVAFANVYDTLAISETRSAPSIEVAGPESVGVPADPSNLVLKAAQLCGMSRHIVLEKNLPSAAGIGGGSADAAAVVRAFAHEQGIAPCSAIPATLMEQLAQLGADIPMCLDGTTLRARGIGDELSKVSLPSVPMVLVNPRKAVETPPVFRALKQKDNPPMPEDLPNFGGVSDLVDFLKAQRNDLETPALSVAPVIAKVLEALGRSERCTLARMSGSGATCFGLFDTQAAADHAAENLRASNPEWWVKSGVLGDASALAAVEVS